MHLAPDSIPEDLILKGAYRLDSSYRNWQATYINLAPTCQKCSSIILTYQAILLKRVTFNSSACPEAVLQDMAWLAATFWAKQAVGANGTSLLSLMLYPQQNVERIFPMRYRIATFIKKLELEGQEA
jgi:hypothetical protein